MTLCLYSTISQQACFLLQFICLTALVTTYILDCIFSYQLHNDKFYFQYLKKNTDKTYILVFKLDFECRTFTCSGLLSQCGIATFTQVKESNTSSTTDMSRQNLFEIQVAGLFQTSH